MPPKSRPRKPAQTTQSSYKIYYSRLLKQIHAGHGLNMSKEAVSVMDSLMNDVFEKIVNQATHMMRTNNRKVLADRDIHFAVKLVLTPELAKYAVEYGESATKRAKNELLPQNSLESNKNSSTDVSHLSKTRSEDHSSDLVYDTFRSNVRGHSSPIRDLIVFRCRPVRVPDPNVMESSDSNINVGNAADDSSFDFNPSPRQNSNGNEVEDVSRDADGEESNDNGEIEDLRYEASIQIERHVRNLPVVQQGFISALIGCIPNFLMHRRNNRDDS